MEFICIFIGHNKSTMKIYKTILLIFLLSVIARSGLAQNDTLVSDGFNRFYYENGTVSSEGFLENGKPNGYWKTYYESGILKSEGNRRNFELDSTWVFYNEKGDIILKINYKKGKKHGLRITYREDGYYEENFENDVKNGFSNEYFPNGALKSTTFFKSGLENGINKTYNRDGLVIRLVEYKSGFVVSREDINYTDMKGDRQGRWVTFWENGNIHTDGTYRDGRRHGYFKTYDKQENLLTVEKYDNGVLLKDAQEVAEIEMKTDYYPDGRVKVIAGFRNGKPEGIRREYDRNGKVVAASVFKNGILTGEGIIDDRMEKDGPWKEYYDDGSLRAEGVYTSGKRTGNWKFYYADGSLQQEGAYNKYGNYDGEWKWYFPSGKLLRSEFFINGREEGMMQEFDENGNTVVEGLYVDGLEEGKWTYITGDTRQTGEYRSGMRYGTWKTFSADGDLLFKGDYIDDNPNGRHVHYWDNGKIKDDATWLMGQRHGEWIKYNYEGEPFITISYRNGMELKYDGVQINE